MIGMGLTGRPARAVTVIRSNQPATSSAILAPRAPMGRSGPSVVSRAVWCSISASSSAPTSTTVEEIQIQVMKPITAPSEP